VTSTAGKIRPAMPVDFQRVYPLLQQLNDTRMTREVWQRLFLPLWREPEFCPGYVVEDGDSIVGFIGTLYSVRQVGGVEHRVCNLTSWIVLPEYRHQSVMLLLPILRDKSVTLTSLTSSPEAYAVYKKLGFKDLDSSARVIYRFPPLLPGRCRLYRGSEAAARLDPSLQQIYRDHANLDLEHCVVEGHGGSCYLVAELKRGRAHLHFVSEPRWFRDHVSAFRYQLLSALGVKTLQLDERFLQQKMIFPSRRKVFDQPKQLRSTALVAGDIDALYSELVVLATAMD
jgi:hypothetical protein